MATGNEIAIIGLSGRLPGARNVGEFWENLKSGRESIKPDGDSIDSSPRIAQSLPGHWVKCNGLLQDVDLFDASFFGFSPREAEMTDPQHRIILECAWEASEDAGYTGGDTSRHAGVFVGASLSGYLFSQVHEGTHLLEALPAMIANDKDYLATRISYQMNLSGPSITVQSACSTSLVAVHLACQSLIAGECDAALAGGISVAVPRIDKYFYLPGGILSPDGRCRAFDANAKGTSFAEGVGVVVLMRLEDALRDNYQIYAVILGSAVNNDGNLKAGYTAPSIEGQIQVIQQAHAVAGVDPSEISYIETHGTGTVLGDAVELAALTRVFRAATQEVGYCGLGSIKTNIGHASTASGVAGLIKTVLTLKHRALPGHVNFEQPNPDLNFATSPFFINTKLVPWDTRDGAPRRAGVSSFGVGGTNAHVVVEEAPLVQCFTGIRAWHLLPLSTKSESALARATDNLRNHLLQSKTDDFSDVVYTYQVGRRVFDYRTAVICSDPSDAVRALDSLDAERVSTNKVTSPTSSVAFLFPGQGAQYVGMGLELYKTEPVFREHVDSCLTRVQDELDLDLRSALYPSGAGGGETAALQDTELAQPALFITEYALTKLLESWGIRPAMMIGHSIGEYVAACVSGVLSLRDALRLVVIRGRMMQQMQAGSMLSIALSPEELHEFLGDHIDIAAINAPNQCVVSGKTDVLAQLEQRLLARKVMCRKLRTSHAFHSYMMEPMLGAVTRAVADVKLGAPTVPYISNVTGSFITEEEIKDSEYWARQIRQPVRFARGIESLIERNAEVFVEVGPGRSLSALARQCGVEARGVTVVNAMPDQRANASEAFWSMRALAKLWLAGVAVEWSGLYGEEKPRRVSVPTYPFERQRFWSERKATGNLQTESEKKLAVSDWFYAPNWKRLGPIDDLEQGNIQGRCVLLFCDRFGVGSEVAESLRTAGAEVLMVEVGQAFKALGSDAYSVNPLSEADYEQLLAKLASDGKMPNYVVHLWSLAPLKEDSCDATIFRSSQDIGLFSLLRFFKMLNAVRGTAPLTIDIVANGLFDVIGDEPLAPQNAPVLALVKVIPQQHHNITCRIFDIVLRHSEDGVTHSAKGLAQHIAAEPKERVWAFRNGYRWSQRFDRIAVDDIAGAKARLKQGGVYLITGGLGNIGLTLARYLAQKCGARLVLTARTALPEKAEWQACLADPNANPAVKKKIRALCEIEQAGGEVCVIQANVASEEEMRGVRQFVEQKYGRLDGVVFGAGRVTWDRGIFEETAITECEMHFESKAHGLMVLERVLQKVKLDFCIVLSSLSTILGGLGHLAYSAANHFADAFVHHHNRARPDTWITANWDAWQFEEDLSEKSELNPTLLRFAIQPQEGVEAFEFLLKIPAAVQVVICTRQLDTRLQEWIGLRSLKKGQKEHRQVAQSYARPKLGTLYAPPEGDLEQRIAQIWQDALGIDRVGRDDDFFEVGGHSLLAIQVLGQIREAFGVDFPIDKAFEANTVRKATEVIDQLLMAKIEGFTEEEAQDLLQESERV